MLTFLRKIRKALIEKGNARKYLLYAIGEIALVVIGILIALQINNWNENQKNKNSEANLYTNVLVDLEKDSSKLAELIHFYSNRKDQLAWLLKELRDMDSSTDIIEFGKHVEPLYYNEEAVSYSATFDASKSSGDFSNFREKDILKELTQYYADFTAVSDLTSSTLRIIESQLEPLVATIPEHYIVKESGDNVIAEQGINEFYDYIASFKDNRNIQVDLEKFLQKPEFENYIIGDLGRSFNSMATFRNRLDRITVIKTMLANFLNQ